MSLTTANDSATAIYITARSYSGSAVPLWPAPPQPQAGGIRIRDIAAHLGKITYFPDSPHAPFTAAQYAIELSKAVRRLSVSTHLALHALFVNCHEAYLGHIPPAARQAERYMTMPPIFEDRRDQLIDSMRKRIYATLMLPLETGGEPATIGLARAQLDATLERDLGAYIHRRSGDVRAEPLPQVITPMRWDKTIERYERTYEELGMLSGRQTAR